MPSSEMERKYMPISAPLATCLKPPTTSVASFRLRLLSKSGSGTIREVASRRMTQFPAQMSQLPLIKFRHLLQYHRHHRHLHASSSFLHIQCGMLKELRTISKCVSRILAGSPMGQLQLATGKLTWRTFNMMPRQTLRQCSIYSCTTMSNDGLATSICMSRRKQCPSKHPYSQTKPSKRSDFGTTRAARGLKLI
jgi:hypothetical protein